LIEFFFSSVDFFLKIFTFFQNLKNSPRQGTQPAN